VFAGRQIVVPLVLALFFCKPHEVKTSFPDEGNLKMTYGDLKNHLA